MTDIFLILFILIVSQTNLIVEATTNNETDVNFDNNITITDYLTIEEYPFLVSLHYDNGLTVKHICSGTILSELWILTAAHCVCYTYTTNIINAKNLYVIVGLQNLTNLRISNNKSAIQAIEIHKHSKYSFHELKNNIALIKLSVPLLFSKDIQPINIAIDETWKGKHTKDIFEACVAVGWSKENLHDVLLNILENAECGRLVNGIDIHSSEICTLLESLEDDICQEESGGPLLCGEEQVGVATFRLGCGYYKTPSVWTRVDYYSNWIWIKSGIQLMSTRNERGGGRPFRPGGGSGWGRLGGGSPIGPGGRRPSVGGSWSRPGRPGGGGSWGRPGGGGSWGRPGRPGWGGSWGRPGRPGGGRHMYGSRPGGRYAYSRVNVYAYRGSYYRPYGYGGYGYYGIGYHGYGYGMPLGLCAMYHYHMMYGYGYAGYGGYSNYNERPPPNYAASYCKTEGGNAGASTKDDFMNKTCEAEPGFYNARSDELCPKHKVFCDKSNYQKPVLFLLILSQIISLNIDY